MGKIKWVDNERWAKTRKMGLLKYTLLVGTLLYGGIMFIIHLFLNRFYIYDNLTLTRFMWIFSFVLWMIAGTLFGLLTWWFNERAYKKFHSREMQFKRFLDEGFN
jgi:hypothetical protein